MLRYVKLFLQLVRIPLSSTLPFFIKNALKTIKNVEDVVISLEEKSAIVLCSNAVNVDDLIDVVKSSGYNCKLFEKPTKEEKLSVTGMMCLSNCGSSVVV